MTEASDPLRTAAESPNATLSLGKDLGQSLIGGVVIGLVGPLGAGKTQLVKGIAVGNGMDDVRYVSSPTFVLISEYPGSLTLHHVDAYRLSTPEEFLALGFEELVSSDSAVAVEWADRVAGAMPNDTLWVRLEITGDMTRAFELRATGALSRRCLESLQARLGHTDA